MEQRLVLRLARLTIAANLVVVLGGTLFPFAFSWRNRRSLSNSFGLAKDIAPRGNDLLIGVDGNLGQSFKGRIDDLRIYRRARSADEIAGDTARGADSEAPHDSDLVLSYAFDESSGDVVPDASGMKNDGRLVKAPQWVEGKHTGGLRFSGAGEYVRVPNSASIDVAGRGITVSMWLALEGPIQRFDQTILSKPWHSNSGAHPWFQYGVEFDSNGSQSVDFYFGDSSGRPRGPYFVRPPVGPWTHVAFTYDGQRVRGYVDGREQLSSVLDPWQVGDVIRNVLFFMPLGFALTVLLRCKGFSAAAAVVLTILFGSSLSLTIEVAQSLLPHRYSSFVDLATNSIGAAAGAICYMFLRFRVPV